MSLTLNNRCSFQFLFRDVNMPRWSRNLADHSRTRAPSQSGRNLGDRYLILEKSLGGKEALKKCRNSHRQQHGTDTINVPTLSLSVFRGFIVPMEPPPPESDGTIAFHDRISLTHSRL